MDLDTENGLRALKAFHNKSTIFSGYTYSFDEFLRACFGNSSNIYAEGIGLEIRMNNHDMSDVESAMQSMAVMGLGRIPKDRMAFQKYLGKKAGEINWITITKDSFIDVGTQVGEGIVSVGDNALTIVSTLNKFMVPIVLIFVGTWLYAQFKRVKK